jgi:hypothetical protein
MKHIFAAASVLWAAAVLPPPALAQPPGTYLRSCRDISMRNDSLTATCRTRDGNWQRTRLNRVRGCVGDIGNNDGQLICDRR